MPPYPILNDEIFALASFPAFNYNNYKIKK